MADSATTTGIRTIDGREVPATGTWAIDPQHQSFEFIARHLMVNKVRGSFTDVTGTVAVAEDPTESTVAITIQVDSVDSGTADRDEHLRSPDFFDAATYPTITFRSTSIRPDGDGWSVTGDLTIREMTRPVTLAVEFLGVVTDPWGNPKTGISATGALDREDFDLTWNVPLSGGGVLVSKNIKLEIEAQLALAA
jgi:polyisoprenoid-binding protein YceI